MKRPGRTEILLILGVIFVLMFSHLPVIYTFFYHTITNSSKAQDGHVSVSEADNIVLDGEWEFYWNRLLVTDQQEEAVPDFLINVPDYWSKYKLDKQYLPQDGFASYRLKLVGGHSLSPVTIYIPDFGSAYRVYIDGILTSESGTVSKNPYNVFTTTKAKLYPVVLTKNQEHDVIIEVATTRFSGLYMAPVMEDYEGVLRSEYNRNNLRFLLFGTALFSFFALVVGYILSFRTARRSVWVPAIGLLVLLRIMLTTEFYGFWQDIAFFGLSYETANYLMFLISFAFKYLLIFLIEELLGIGFSKREKLGLLLYYIVLYMLYLFIPHDFYNRYLTILLPVCAFLMEIYAFFKIYLNRGKMKKYGMLVYFGAVLSITGLILDCYYINGNVYLNLSLMLLLLFTGYLMILGLVASIQAADIYRDFAVSSAHLASAREQIAMQTEYYDELSQQINEVRAIRHDFRHFVSVLKRLSDEGRQEELRSFLSEYGEKADTEPLPVFCENVVANSILGFYSLRFKEHQTSFRCSCQIPKALSISDSDLCVVLGNALENALEGCKKLENPELRSVSVESRMLSGQMLLKITNTYGGTLKQTASRYLTTKEKPYHGIGLQNIQKVVNAYGGYVKIEHGERVFTLMAAFQESGVKTDLK